MFCVVWHAVCNTIVNNDKMSRNNIVQQTVVTMKEVKSDAVMFNGEAYVYHNTGLTRRVFVNKEKTKVVKIPVSEHDFEHNRNEAEMWENATDEQRATLTPCRLLSNGWLEMDFLYTLNDPETDVKWGHIELSNLDIQFASSCRNEVGFDTEGKLRCYDYDEYRKY